MDLILPKIGMRRVLADRVTLDDRLLNSDTNISTLLPNQHPGLQALSKYSTTVYWPFAARSSVICFAFSSLISLQHGALAGFASASYLPTPQEHRALRADDPFPRRQIFEETKKEKDR